MFIPVVKPLNAVTVLVTRPNHQADHLCQLIQSHGGSVLRFPLLSITGPRNPAAVRNITSRLAEFDMVIFISPNAVDWGMQIIEEQGGLPTKIKVAAVGQGSARQLAQRGVRAEIFPSQQFNSEALLAMEEMRSVAGKRIAIYRGEGGREHLAEVLRERGATVEYAECYRRAKHEIDPNELARHLSRGDIDIVTVTSSESLQNLHDLVEGPARSALLALPVIVVSERTQLLARQLGFKSSVVIADKPGDEEIVQAVINWRLHVSMNG